MGQKSIEIVQRDFDFAEYIAGLELLFQNVIAEHCPKTVGFLPSAVPALA
jgi:hypothetical protein